MAIMFCGTMRYMWDFYSDSVQRLSTQSSMSNYRPVAGPYVTRWQWHWLDERGVWQKYDQSDAIEKEFLRDKRCFSFYVNANGFRYTIDFQGTLLYTVVVNAYFFLHTHTSLQTDVEPHFFLIFVTTANPMIQENVTTGTRRQVRRRPRLVYFLDHLITISELEKSVDCRGTAMMFQD